MRNKIMKNSLIYMALVFFPQFCFAMNGQIVIYPSSTDSYDPVHQKYVTLGLENYYSFIERSRASSQQEAIQDNEVVGILSDAVKNIKEAFRSIDDRCVTFGGDMLSDDPTLQKMYCEEALSELYASLSAKFEGIHTPKAEAVREDLRQLRVIE
jgi:hypothetical protein